MKTAAKPARARCPFHSRASELGMSRPLRAAHGWRRDRFGQWRHGPWWKKVINGFLRLFQPQRWKWVVYTRTREAIRPGEPPVVLGYGFGRIEHL